MQKAGQNKRSATKQKFTWAGQEAKQFDNRRDWLLWFKIMSMAFLLLTVPIFWFMVRADVADMHIRSPWLRILFWALLWFAVAAGELVGLLLNLLGAWLVASLGSVSVGENGIESRVYGYVFQRLPWSEVRQVELYTALGMHGVRIFRPGKRFAVHLPITLDAADAVFHEVGERFGYANTASPSDTTQITPTQTATARTGAVASEKSSSLLQNRCG